MDDLVQKAPLRPGLSAQRATDVLVVLLGPETYRAFVTDLGWSHDEWAMWTTTALLRGTFGLDPADPAQNS